MVPLEDLEQLDAIRLQNAFNDRQRAVNDWHKENNRRRWLNLESHYLDAAEAHANLASVGVTPFALDMLAETASDAREKDFGKYEKAPCVAEPAFVPSNKGKYEKAPAFVPSNKGKRVEVWWDEEQRSFEGVIVQISRKKGAKVLYDDKDLYWEKKVTLLPGDSGVVAGKRARTPPRKLGDGDGWGSSVAGLWSSGA